MIFICESNKVFIGNDEEKHRPLVALRSACILANFASRSARFACAAVRSVSATGGGERKIAPRLVGGPESTSSQLRSESVTTTSARA